MGLPSHPESEDTTPYQPPPRSWGTKVAIVVFVVLFLAVVVLHLTGVVGPGAH